MEKVFNEAHIEELNQFFMDFVLETIEKSEEIAKKRKLKDFTFTINCPDIFSFAMKTVGENVVDVFTKTANRLSGKIMFYYCNCSHGRIHLFCKSKEMGYIIIKNGYKYIPEISTLTNSWKTRIITEVPYADVGSAYSTMMSILKKNESINCTYKQLIEKAAKLCPKDN